jgi:hypothetical protein
MALARKRAGAAVLLRALRALAPVALCCLSAAHAGAGWREASGTPVLVGEADARFWGFRLYHATLWSDRRPFDPARPFALELRYYRSISRDRIVSTSIDEIARLAAADRASAGDAPGSDSALPSGKMQQWRQRLLAAMVDVDDGDRLIGVYLPGRGVRFYLVRKGQAEQVLGEIDDDEFARAFFAIWLDSHTREPSLRAHLLGAGG